jgi:hypothetical protein
MPQCPNCQQSIEPQTWHEALPLNQCRVKEEGSNIPLYTSRKNSSGWGKE